VKISYVEITTRSNYPTIGRKNLHIWEPTLQTLAKQTMKDFEVIIVDIFYHERPDYFKKHNYGLKIKHVPSAPNVWFHSGQFQPPNHLGQPHPCHQINKGFIHADGELLFVNGDSFMYPPDLMENLWRHYQEGYFVGCGLVSELTYFEENKFKKTTAEVTGGIPTEWYRFLGFDGRVHVHDRYMKYLIEPGRDMASILPGQYYGVSTLSLEAALKVNGFDQAFDGDNLLADCDMGKRLALAGYKEKLAMFKDCYSVEAMADLAWHPKMRQSRNGGIKCNYALMMFNELTCRYRANDPLSEADIKWIIDKICLGGRCNQMKVCKELHTFFPFFLKESKELFEYWKKYQAPLSVDLELEREMRIDGEEEYAEGTFVNI